MPRRTGGRRGLGISAVVNRQIAAVELFETEWPRFDPELGILDEIQAAELARAAGLRNRLAHEYNGIDERMVHQAARRTLSELPEYLRAIEEYIDTVS